MEEKGGPWFTVERQVPTGKHGWSVGVGKSFCNHHSED